MPNELKAGLITAGILVGLAVAFVFPILFFVGAVVLWIAVLYVGVFGLLNDTFEGW